METNTSTKKPINLNFKLFRYGYNIKIKSTYCGATAHALKPRPGEDWIRGSDLKDGKWYNLPSIVWDIICYEMRWGRFAT